MTNKKKEQIPKGDKPKKELIAHLRADNTLLHSTAEALIEMINLATANLKKKKI